MFVVSSISDHICLAVYGTPRSQNHFSTWSRCIVLVFMISMISKELKIPTSHISLFSGIPWFYNLSSSNRIKLRIFYKFTYRYLYVINANTITPKLCHIVERVNSPSYATKAITWPYYFTIIRSEENITKCKPGNVNPKHFHSRNIYH